MAMVRELERETVGRKDLVCIVCPVRGWCGTVCRSFPGRELAGWRRR